MIKKKTNYKENYAMKKWPYSKSNVVFNDNGKSFNR